MSSNKVLFLTVPFLSTWGGLTPSVLYTARMLRTIGYESHVLDSYGLIEQIELLDAVPEYREKRGSSSSIDFSSYQLIVYVGQWHSLKNLLLLLFKERLGKKIFLAPKGSLCGIEFSRFRDIKKVAYFLTVGWQVVLLSRGTIYSSILEQKSSIWPSRFLSKETVVIPEFYPLGNFLSSSTVSSRKSVKREAVRLSFMAEISPRKGLKELIEALIALSVKRNKIMDSIDVTIGGDARPGSENYYNSLKSSIESAGLGEVVRFTGRINPEEKCQFFNHTDVFMAVSRFESYGLTVLEALESGCHVIAHKKIGVLEYLQDGDRLLVVDSLDADSIASAIESALDRMQRIKLVDQVDRSMLDRVNTIATDRWKQLAASIE